MAASPSPDNAVVAIRVSPRSSTNRFSVEGDGSIKVWLTAPPVDGVANRALLAYLGHILDLPPSSLKIIRGESSRTKRVSLPLSTEQLAERLAAASERRKTHTTRKIPRQPN
jgi:uncharacterized protein (TIGR00251 family)